MVSIVSGRSGVVNDVKRFEIVRYISIQNCLHLLNMPEDSLPNILYLHDEMTFTCVATISSSITAMGTTEDHIKEFLEISHRQLVGY